MARRRRASGGFTILEVLVSMAVLAIGLIGVVAMQRTSMRASGYSRHATEAAVLGEDKLEQLRTVDIAFVGAGSETVDALGQVSSTGLFTRSWTIEWESDLATLEVTVAWGEDDGAHQVSFRTVRSQ
jgi:prepilin-type N-terminal cleavage/methylation domain-containing protein